MKQEIMHYPRLDTVLMVEETLKELGRYPTRTELWKALPKKVMYQTFMMIIDYLQELGKIMIDQDGRIIWTWNPQLVKRVMREGLVLK